jgi:hypothetical protein
VELTWDVLLRGTIAQFSAKYEAHMKKLSEARVRPASLARLLRIAAPVCPLRVLRAHQCACSRARLRRTAPLAATQRCSGSGLCGRSC